MKAECDFGRAGKIILTEHFQNEKNGLTYDGDLDTPDDRPLGKREFDQDETDIAAKAKRYINVTVDYFNTLCPRSSYTLTFHQYNNVARKCKNVGPLLNGATSIVSDSLATNSRGDLTSGSNG